MNTSQQTFQNIRLNNEQRSLIGSLIETERRHLSAWWTCLNELRRRNELPGWAKAMPVGHEKDYDRWCKDRKAVNKFLFGSEAILLTSAEGGAEEGGTITTKIRASTDTPATSTSREQLFRDLVGLAVQLETILISDVIPLMKSVGHPLTGRVHSLRSEIKLRASLIGGAQ